MDETSHEFLVELTAHVVGAYVESNPTPISNLPQLIESVSQSLNCLMSDAPSEKPATSALPNPAINPKKSVRSDHIVCLEDGQKYKSLKRHLKYAHSLTADEYRKKWNLPADYPMVAPAYSQRRSEIAHSFGLGTRKGGRKVKKSVKK